MDPSQHLIRKSKHLLSQTPHAENFGNWVRGNRLVKLGEGNRLFKLGEGKISCLNWVRENRLVKLGEGKIDCLDWVRGNRLVKLGEGK